jgi:acyl-[acyl-carrier-protein]-phospholipid O-acyltransferase/long-chain-fatty-acid--[acyl-carrier-protein] ligase
MSSSPSILPKNFRIVGEDRVPEEGFLLVPSRLDGIELACLQERFAGRSLEYLVEDGALADAEIAARLSAEGVAPIAFALPADDAGRKRLRENVRKATAGGKILVFVSAPAKAQPATFCCVPPAVLSALLSAGSTVLPLFVDRPLEILLSIEKKSGPAGAGGLVFGSVLRGEGLTLAGFQESMLAAAEMAFSQCPLLECHLAYALLMGLKKHGSVSRVIDGFDGMELRFDKVLAAAIALSKHLKEETKAERIGIILPPGKGGLIANLAVLLAGRVPVNLNFTAGAESVESSIRQAELDRFITADAFMRKQTRFPWPPTKQIIFIERLIPTLKKKMIFWGVLSKILPAPVLATVLGVPKKGREKEAVLLFTSGSSGEPKGVALSHRNVLANVKQFSGRLELEEHDKVLGCLPLFHSFGCTVTLWYPVIEGLDLVTYPSPLDPPTLAGLIEKHRVSLLLSTPTFLRGYLRKVTPEQLAPLKLVVVGAEKLPQKLARIFKEKFDKDVLEGYGLTETSPATNVNLPDPVGGGGGGRVIPSHRQGSVGQMLPGIALRVTDPATDGPLPIDQSGMIWLRGANIFGGYLKLPRQTEEVLKDGWFRTGDIGRMDEDGFLYIEGRMSRFSKIAGEMVPHEKVEEQINLALGIESEDERRIAIVGVPDEAKGEALVLLTTQLLKDEDVTNLRYALLEKGVAALWIPKRIVHVGEIPVLASGKLDIKGCEKAVQAV